MQEQVVDIVFQSADQESILPRLAILQENPDADITLSFEDCPITNLLFLEPLGLFSRLKGLSLTNCFLLENLEFLNRCNSLETLELKKLLVSAAEYDHISKLANLKKIVIDYVNDLEHLDFLSGLAGLQLVQVTRCTQVRDIAALEGLTGLKELNLASSGSGYISDYSPISAMTQLESLVLSNHLRVENLDFLTPLLHLQRLDLRFCVNLENAAVLEHLVHLKYLNLTGCDHIEQHHLNQRNN